MGLEGLEPSKSNDGDFTDRCNCHYATTPNVCVCPHLSYYFVFCSAMHPNGKASIENQYCTPYRIRTDTAQGLSLTPLPNWAKGAKLYPEWDSSPQTLDFESSRLPFSYLGILCSRWESNPH